MVKIVLEDKGQDVYKRQTIYTANEESTLQNPEVQVADTVGAGTGHRTKRIKRYIE